MNSVKVRVKRLPNCKDLPAYATGGSAGLDLTAAIEKPLVLPAGQRAKIPTGLIFEIPTGYEGQLRARSGLAAKAGITLTNSVGTVDSDYRGEVMVLVINLGDDPYTFEPGERIAQLVVMPVPKVELEEVDDLDYQSQRGSGGFGSTGRTALPAAGSLESLKS